MNARGRFALGKLNNDVQESRRDQMSSSSDSSRYIHTAIMLEFLLLNKDLIVIFKEYFFRPSREYYDAQKGTSKSNYSSDDEESAKIVSSSLPLSVLLIPSLKEVNSHRFCSNNVTACCHSKLVCSAKYYFNFNLDGFLNYCCISCKY